jgi:hypothetical protein
MNLRLLVFYLFILTIFSGCLSMSVENSRNYALKIATNEVVKLGYNLNDFETVFDIDNTLWKEYTKATGLLKRTSKMKNILKNRSFYYVYFQPKDKDTLDGDVSIFIDKHTKKIFMALEGYHVKYY